MPSRKRKAADDGPAHSQCYDWDFTFFGNEECFPEVPKYVKMLQPLFKKWAFQIEKAPKTGKLHYQGRGSLFKKKRQSELCTLLNDTPLKGMEVSPTANASRTKEAFYMLKYDTRVEGPWMDTTWTEPIYVPRQYRGLIDRLLPFQQTILDSRNVFNDRIVNLVIDKSGSLGKSTCASLGQLHFGGLDLPPVSDHKELTQAACDILMAKEQRVPGIVFCDLPRALTMGKNPKLGPFMVAIEQIKKGHVVDMRNHYKEWWFDSPAVWIFCNNGIDVKYMSRDRWRFWGIGDQKELHSLSREEVQAMVEE